MTEQWQELKETITEMRDNDGTCTQQEVCKFLVNYMEILEKQIPKDNVLDKIRDEIVHLHDWMFSREEVLKIIDEYKAENEDK